MMLHTPPATLRTWEERYGVVSPERTQGGHRLYSRAQIEQLRFVIAEMANGASAADAHRALAQRQLLVDGVHEEGERGPLQVLVLIAERDQFSAEMIEFLLRAEGLAVEATLDADEARHRFERTRPDLVIVEFLLGGGEGETLCHWLKEQGAPAVLVVSGLDAADRAMRAGGDAFLRKPVAHLHLLSVVHDLLGARVIVGQAG